MSQFALHSLQQWLAAITAFCSQTLHHVRPRIVANMFDTRTRIARRFLSTLNKDFGEILCRTMIHRTTQLAEAAMRGMPIRKLAPYSNAHEDFADLATEIVTEPDLFNTPAPFPARILFSYFDPAAREVMVAGDFNDWHPSERHKLVRDQSGIWKLRVPLDAGKYRYKFVVDGQWQEDPANPRQETDKFGRNNSVLDVGKRHEEA
jgi:hypothetical protein